MKANHPWVMQWMEVRWQRDLGITDEDVRMMRKDVPKNDEEDDDSVAVNPDDEEDDDREAEKKKADDDADDADAEEERAMMDDMYILRGYRVSR
jgi:hypothetical protein